MLFIGEICLVARHTGGYTNDEHHWGLYNVRDSNNSQSLRDDLTCTSCMIDSRHAPKDDH